MEAGESQEINGWNKKELAERLNKLHNRTTIAGILKQQSLEFRTHFCNLLRNPDFNPNPNDLVPLREDFESAKREFLVLIRSGRFDQAIAFSDKRADIDFESFPECRDAIKSTASMLEQQSNRADEVSRVQVKFPGLFSAKHTGRTPQPVPNYVISDITIRLEEVSQLMAIREKEIAVQKKKFAELIASGDTQAAFEITQRYLDVDFYEDAEAKTAARKGYVKALGEWDYQVAVAIIRAFKIPVNEFKSAVEIAYKGAVTGGRNKDAELLRQIFSGEIDFSKITVVRPVGSQPSPNPDVDQYGTTDLRDGSGAIDKSLAGAREKKLRQPSFEVDKTLFINAVILLLDGEDIPKALEAADRLEKDSETHYPELAEAVKRLFIKLIKNEFVDHAKSIADKFSGLDYKNDLRAAYLYHIQQGNISVCEYIGQIFNYKLELFEAFVIDVHAGYLTCLRERRTDEARKFEEQLGEWAGLAEVKAKFIKSRSSDDEEEVEPEYDEEEIEPEDDEEERGGSAEFQPAVASMDEVELMLLANDRATLEWLKQLDNKKVAEVFSYFLTEGDMAASLPIYNNFPHKEYFESLIRNEAFETLSSGDKNRFRQIYKFYPEVLQKMYFDFLTEGLLICAKDAERFLPKSLTFESSDIQQAAHQGVLASLREGRIENTEDMHAKYLSGEIMHIEGFHDAVRDGFYNCLVAGDIDVAKKFRKHFGRFTDFDKTALRAYWHCKNGGNPDLAEEILDEFEEEIMS